jgi:hypothetical protein
MAFLADLRESGSVSICGMTNSPVPAIKLHSALDLKRRRICRVTRYTDQHEPFLVWSNTVIDDLSASQCSMSIEDFFGGARSGR